MTDCQPMRIPGLVWLHWPAEIQVVKRTMNDPQRPELAPAPAPAPAQANLVA